MDYKEKLSAEFHGENAKRIRKEIKKRGNYKGVRASIVREAVNQFFATK